MPKTPYAGSSDLSWTIKHIRSGQMNRRDFLQLAGAAGLALGAANSIFTTQARATPTKGGKFRAALGQGGTTDTMDPATWGTNYFTTELGSITGNSLIEVDAQNNAVPGLAEAFESSDGAKSWIFKLKKGVTFHNGKTMTPDDVLTTLNYHLDEKSKSSAKPILANIAEMKADGDNAVRFTLKGGNSDFPYDLSNYRLAIFPSKDGKMDWSKGGTGPFITKSFDPGVMYSAKRNLNYHGEAPYFDELELRPIIDATARTNALLGGEADYIDRCDLKTIDGLKQNADIEIDNAIGFSHLVATMNTTIAPFDNPNIRLAIKHAFKRDELVEKILQGYGTIGNDNPIAPTIKFATNPEPKHSYDPEKAKAYLKKAGLGSLKIDLSTSEGAFSGAVDAAQLMKESAAACGIEINVILEPADSYWDNVWLKKPFLMSYWGGRANIDGMATLAYSADAAWNDTFWKSPRFNELVVQARSEADEAKRAAMYAEMQQLLHDDGGQVVLAFNNYVTAHSTKVGHGELNSNFDHDGTYMWRRWWFKA